MENSDSVNIEHQNKLNALVMKLRQEITPKKIPAIG